MPITTETIKLINDGSYDGILTELYGSENVEKEKTRYCSAINEFGKMYGKNREISLYSTPGRTEIGGNHTDHNQGVVLAASVDLDIIAVVAKSESDFINVKSEGFSRTDNVETNCLEADPKDEGCSCALVRGVAEEIKRRGGVLGGLDVYTTSNVLRGSGLSSSAAYEVCIGSILNGEYNNNKFTAVELGQIGQYAENVHFGKPSGLMDQTACAVGGAITIDFKDTAHPIVEAVKFDLAYFGYKLVVTDTKGNHAGLTDEYAAIAGEMKSVAAYFGKSVLREITVQDVLQNVLQLREKLGDRAVMRALHFFAECERVGELSAAVKASDFESFKKLIIESGHSSFEYNQNAYSVKSPSEQGVSLGLALSQNVLAGKGAWRLQGGGFAGTIQAFVPVDILAEYCNLLESVFGQGACYVLSIRAKGAIKL